MEVEGCGCPLYMSAWCKMMSKRDKANTDFEKLQVITKFAEKYTMLPHYWLKFLELSKRCNMSILNDDFTFLYSTTYGNKEAKHIEWPHYDYVVWNLSHVFDPLSGKHINRFKIAEDALKFPHKLVKCIYKSYMFFATRSLSKNIYQESEKNQKLYDKMKNNEDNIDEWLFCLKDINDMEAVVANLELKIGQKANWTNKKIWNFYFNFLKENNRKEILEVYRKYTRLFICDKKSVEDYRNEIEKYSMWNVPTSKYWIDTVKYEMDFGNLKYAYLLLKRALKAVIGKNIKITGTGKMSLYQKLEEWKQKMEEIERFRLPTKDTNENIRAQEYSLKPSLHFSYPQQSQNFCFRQSFVQRLLKVANGYILGKLYSTCKFFYAFHKIRLCYRLEISVSIEISSRYIDANLNYQYCNESLYLKESAVNTSVIHKLDVYGVLLCLDLEKRNSLSSVLQNIFRCNVRWFEINKQDVTFDEFKILLSENLIRVYMRDVRIYQNNDEVNGMDIFNFTKNKVKFELFENYDKKNFIFCCYNKGSHHFQPFRSNIENIYIVGAVMWTETMRLLLESTNLKTVTLRNITLNNFSISLSTKNDIEAYVKTKTLDRNVLIDVV